MSREILQLRQELTLSKEKVLESQPSSHQNLPSPSSTSYAAKLSKSAANTTKQVTVIDKTPTADARDDSRVQPPPPAQRQSRSDATNDGATKLARPTGNIDEETGCNDSIFDTEIVPDGFGIVRCDRNDGRRLGGAFLVATSDYELKKRVLDENVDTKGFEIVCSMAAMAGLAPEPGGAESAARVHLSALGRGQVRAALRALPPKRSVGPDGIPPFLLKDCSRVFEGPLLHVYNLCLENSIFPNRWKVTRVTPVPKSSGAKSVSDFRPVATLSTFSKVFESALFKEFYNEAQAQLCDEQHGFRAGRSTTSNLLNFTSGIKPFVDNRIQVDTAYFDFRKAFDLVDNDVLLSKLAAVGCTPKTLHFFADYLKDRKQFVQYGNYVSDPYSTLSGMLVCAEKVIPIVHRLEQVSSGEHVGSLAENLLEALRSQPQCAVKVQQVRDFTRQEKKRLAMAVRERQLGALGMRSNERGQVTAQCSLTQQVAELAEEHGAVCCICREGYKYQPTKVLGIYTFTKRCPVEEYELRARKTLGYSTVSHYNVVHVECHMAAVRLARARDEWESAALQNASTRCNGLLPLWGPHVPESAFASCLARHTGYLQECTGHRDIGHTCTVHDLKLLILRFARGRTFHDDTGGGGPLSNMQLLPAVAHMALYVINT
ncbi:unnamed protein product [Plutella xylostella]|uniref:(diamondback moth) hypothetical protein n=1 Tax=Plutella xylostella TaxID=51655 RepID=A0A8S4E4Q5_PLUXY|nr:unnamed protein product [Plutella xylostella]